MATPEPEKKTKAISEATATLESKAVVDRQFPDLFKTLTQPSQYTENSSDAFQPVVLKKNITMSTSGLMEMKNFDHKSPCGIAPLINRAYFVVRNRLYLWDYVESREVKIHEEADEIVGVGFVKPKPGVFVNNVKQLMIIATTQEIRVIGVVNGAKDLEYVDSCMTTGTTGVHMTQIIGTSQGRVFMLGNDNNVWELDYRSKETWFASRCNKKLQTSGGSFRFLIRFPRDPVVQIAVNESGTVLYQLTKNSCISVVYLGTDGYTFSSIYKKNDCIADAKRSNPSFPHFTPDLHIVSIHTTTAKESLNYHLVAITSNGGRIYYNNQKDVQYLNYDAKPSGLITMHVRAPSSNMSSTDLVGKPLYKSALTMFVKNPQASETQSKILTYCPSLANLGNCILPNSNTQLIENGNAIDIHGKVLSIEELPTGQHKEINEFKSLYQATARHFLILTTSGITILAKQRPVDMLHNLLTHTGSDTLYRMKEFEPFFNQFGYLNASSLCFNLISCGNGSGDNSLYDAKLISAQEVNSAEIVLKHFGQVTSALVDSNGRSYSSLHDGLALFMYRVIEGIWTKSLIKETSTSVGKFYSNNIPVEELSSIQRILALLRNLIDRNTKLFPFTPVSPETKSLNNLLELITYLDEAISFFKYIFEDSLDSIIKLVKPASQERLLQSDLKTLLTTSDGMSTVASDLTFALIDYTSKRFTNTDHVVDILTAQCGSFCRSCDVLLFNAAKQIYSARNTNPAQAKAILQDSFVTLTKIANDIPSNKAAEFARQYAEQGCHAYGIRLALNCAKARDPLNASNAYYEANCPADIRQQIFKTKQPFYDIVLEILFKVVKDSSQPSTYRREMMQTTFNPVYDDKMFQFYAYDAFLKDNLAQILIDENPPNLEVYLKNPHEYKRLKLLAVYYRSQGRYDDAAKVYHTLASTDNGNISIEERIDFIAAALMCARSVTSPLKQYEMNNLMEDLRVQRRLLVD
ncbi:Nup133 N terminal like-domain-containing protein [Parasitella parasitica]|nr:Nup133 N terminal like-domain-containing protein [Parasitella parasitica]